MLVKGQLSFFLHRINVAKDIGPKDYDNYEENHPIIVKIKENKLEIEDLKFSEIDEKYVTKQINKVNIKQEMCAS
jgi:hypothetical protein